MGVIKGPKGLLFASEDALDQFFFLWVQGVPAGKIMGLQARGGLYRQSNEEGPSPGAGEEADF
jgi:hypothetical protein